MLSPTAAIATSKTLAKSKGNKENQGNNAPKRADKSPDRGQKGRSDKLDKELRDSTIEKLLSGESDLAEIDDLPKDEKPMAVAEKETLKKKEPA